MAEKGEEPIGSMGTDASLAVLSEKPRLLYEYFKQLFAQVTNPPLDAIREELVTSMGSTIGPERNLLKPERESCRQIHIKYPIIHNEHVAKLRNLPPDVPFRSTTLSMLFDPSTNGEGLAKAMDELCRRASEAVASGYDILILSDRGVSRDLAPIPSLLATAGVHHHLVREGTRTRCALVVESGDAREVHHVSLLLGYGAGVVNPYVAFETIDDMIRQKAHHRHRARQGDPELHQGAQQGRAEGDVEDGDLRAAELLRRAGLRGHRPEHGVHRQVLHPHHVARGRRRHRSHLEEVRCATTARSAASRRRPRSSSRAANISGAATASTTCSTRRRCTSCSTRPAPGQYKIFKEYTKAVDVPEPAPRDAARAVPLQAALGAGAARRSGAGGEDRQALRDRRDVLRLDQRRGARDAGDRHEPAGRQVEHRRGRRGRRALPADGQRRLEAQRDQAGGLGPLRRDERVPRQLRRAADQDGAGRQARRGRPAARATRSTRGLRRRGTRRPAWASSRRRRTTTSIRSRTWRS
jgi:hypothetical protein